MSYDLIICGTGFASSFFLQRWMQRRPKDRVLVLERGFNEDFTDQIAGRRNSKVDGAALFRRSGLKNKDWLFTVGLGGGSNCWWGQTPRMLPEDFSLRAQFGVGYDWPIGYDELELYYEQAEALIGVAGPLKAPYPRSNPCPQPPHNLSGFDRAMMSVFPDGWFGCPTGRASRSTEHRGACCANGVCGLCPVDAKFRIMNEMAELYDPGKENLTLRTGTEVTHLDIEGGRATKVYWRDSKGEGSARGEVIFLGMNAAFNPHILAKSGDSSPLLGRRLNEQASRKILIDFEQVDGFNGGTHITGLGFMFYRGEQRRRRGSVMIENYNAPALLRSEKGKWTSRVILKLVAENIPEDHNQVLSTGDIPELYFRDHSEYAKRALNEVPEELMGMLGKISRIENFWIDSEIAPSEGHINGTTVMSDDPEDGVVDHGLRHHRIANLIVGGSGVFPSAPPTNPSLTIAALSLRSADLLLT